MVKPSEIRGVLRRLLGMGQKEFQCNVLHFERHSTYTGFQWQGLRELGAWLLNLQTDRFLKTSLIVKMLCFVLSVVVLTVIL